MPTRSMFEVVHTLVRYRVHSTEVISSDIALCQNFEQVVERDIGSVRFTPITRRCCEKIKTRSTAHHRSSDGLCNSIAVGCSNDDYLMSKGVKQVCET